MGGGISIEDSRLPKVPTDGSTKEWKILLTKEELTEKYKERILFCTLQHLNEYELNLKCFVKTVRSMCGIALHWLTYAAIILRSLLS